MTESDEQIYSRYLAQRNGDDFRILLERHRESLTLFLCSFVHGTLRLPGSEKREVRMVLFAFAVAALLLIRALRSLRKGG